MKKIRIYISGAISGLSAEEAAKRFYECEQRINSSINCEAVNPFKTGSHMLDWFDNMTIALNYLRSCDKMYVLPHSEQSRGVAVERIYAEMLNIRIIESLDDYLISKTTEAMKTNELRLGNWIQGFREHKEKKTYDIPMQVVAIFDGDVL